jgi:hypothetical protein
MLRLSREITVGFISKDEGRKALAKRHHYPRTVREVLQPLFDSMGETAERSGLVRF